MPGGSRPHGGGHSGDGGEGGEGGGHSGRPARSHGGGSESVSAVQRSVRAEFEAAEGSAGGTRARDSQTEGASPPGDESPSLQSESTPDPAAAKQYVDDIPGNPRSVVGKSAEDLAAEFNAAGYRATVVRTNKPGTSGNAVQVRVQGHPEITNIQVHPGGGRHTPEGSSYWKISTSTAGKTWVIPKDFRGAEELGGNAVRYDE
jgi:hypothetical protein